MNTGKLTRMNRLFSHPSGNMCSVAVDHFPIYDTGLPVGLRQIQSTLAAVVSAKPDAVTIFKGVASSAWKEHAGKIPLIVQSTMIRPDGTPPQLSVSMEEVVRLGADAVAVVTFVYGPGEAACLRSACDVVREAARFDIPVICHTYPRDLTAPGKILHTPDDVAWAARCAVEVGADIVKAPYCGEIDAFSQIVEECPVPLVAAGGPRSDSLSAALQMIEEVMQSGARGATIGRNIWGNPAIIAQAVQAFKSVIHDGKTSQEALDAAEL